MDQTEQTKHTECGRDPHVTSDLFLAGMLASFQVFAFSLFLVDLGPRKCDLEHTSSTDEPIRAAALCKRHDSLVIVL